MNAFTDYLHAAAQYHRENPKQRIGQAYFNFYALTYPTQASKLWGTVLDPFSDDTRLGAFLEAVAQEMEEAA